MSSKYWIKLYLEMLDDPKVARLNDGAYRRFVECLLIAGEEDADGLLPAIEDMAWRLRVDATALAQDLSRLAIGELIELTQTENGDRWLVSAFAERQAPSTGAQRVREHRKRKRKVTKEKENKDKDIEERDTDTDTYRNVTSNVTDVTKRYTNQNLPNIRRFLDRENPFDAKVMAIGEVCQLDLLINRHRDLAEKAAVDLRGFSPEDIRHRYGQPNGAGGWNWYRHDWRGQKQPPQPPTPAAIVDTITLQEPAETAAAKPAKETPEELLLRLGL